LADSVYAIRLSISSKMGRPRWYAAAISTSPLFAADTVEGLAKLKSGGFDLTRVKVQYLWHRPSQGLAVIDNAIEFGLGYEAQL
jgi:hypothetical protein